MKKGVVQKRSSYLSLRTVPLGPGRAVTIRGYDTSGKFVCRLGISSAGISLYSGGKGQKRVCDVTWERLVQILSREG
jgi:hypothetical protein